QVHELDAVPALSSRRRHRVELVVDRVIVRRRQVSRLTDSVEQALATGQGTMTVQVVDDESRELRFSQMFSCERCGTGYEELTPHHFSFNARMGWCPSCEGLGTQRGASPAAIAVHPTRSLLAGALAGWSEEVIDASDGRLASMIRALADHIGFDPHTPWSRLSETQQLTVLQGCGDAWIDLPDSPGGGKGQWAGLRFKWRGYFPAIDRATRSSWQYRKRLEELVTEVPCEACGGSRLQPVSRSARLFDKTLHEICRMPLAELLGWFDGLKLDRRAKRIAGELIPELTSRLRFLVDVGLDYLTLQRGAATLSGGESQRIRLASQIGSGLTGVLYVLDEPTIGLHPRDNGRLIGALNKLRDLGNTILMVEHDREVIDNADHVLDFGPGAGSDGGRIVAEASPKGLRRKRASLTGKYLAGKAAIGVPSNRRVIEPGKTPDGWLEVRGACHHNLREIDAAFPLGRFTCVTGVSGSGKSSLVNEVLHHALAARLHRARLVPGGHEAIVGYEWIDKVINVDQSPLGNSPSSNPATYTGVFDGVRELFAQLPDAKVRGYSPNRFSFNRTGGRCEECQGMGQRCIEMHFLPDVWVTCESCKGRRYLPETLEVLYKGKSVADVLEMRVAEALEHFANVPKLARLLGTLDDVGLGYVLLGQPAPTLSGGEAQRVKLAAELGRPSTGKTLYILDEPTTGLHFDDLKKLLAVLHRLVDLGNTVVCIEHNLDVIKTADWVIDLGPEAGAEGGDVVVEGTPEHVAACRRSYTGRALTPVLAAGPVETRAVFEVGRQRVLEAALQGPVDMGDTTRMPWQVNGRYWHLVEHLDQKGRKARWHADVLEWLIETIESAGDFAPAEWSHRSRIEVKAAGSKTQWFCHARTRGTWVLDVSIRTAPGVFDEAKLQRELGISTLDERPDIPAYGQWSRLSVRRGAGYDDVRLFLHDMKDVRKAALTRFIKRAAKAYFEMVETTAAKPDRGEPWKADGRTWHLSQQSIAANKPKRWRPAVLLELLGLINKTLPEASIKWDNKTAVMVHVPGLKGRLMRLATNHAQGLRFDLRLPKRTLTPTMYDKLGLAPELDERDEHDVILSWVRTTADVDAGQFGNALRLCVESGLREPAAEAI
ncbi:MAG: excinuclease ABC subunit UvrA, partial [Phycisphaerae bacterium]